MKPILITGGGKRLGAEICKCLAANGHDVVIHYRNSKKEAQAIAEACRSYNVKAETIAGDFSNVELLNFFIESYKKRFSKTKGLVNNVGNYFIASSSLTQNSEWLQVFQTNFFTPIFLTNALLQDLKVQKGCIINIGVSGLQAHRAFIKSTAYTLTKSALLSYTISLAKELANEGVKVNMISPGYLENAVDLDESTYLPFKRPAHLSEVAQMVAFLFNPKNEYITGQNIEVAGAVGL